MTTPFHDLAPLYWGSGLPIIPLHPSQKRPAISKWEQFSSRFPTADEMQEWLSDHPAGNIGLPLGPQSGLTMIDIDSDDVDVIATIRGVLPPSPWERVGKKGMALAYRYTGLANFKLKGADGGMVVELLGPKNQIVLPGSIHPDTGRPYAANTNLWEVLGEVQPLPDDVKERLQSALGPKRTRTVAKEKILRPHAAEPIDLAGVPGKVGQFLGLHLASACEEIAGLTEGNRNNTLFKHAVGLAKMFTGAQADWDEACRHLTAAGLACGLEEHAIAASLDSAFSHGSANPARWLAVARDWIFVAGEDKYYHPASGAKIKPQAFRTEFAAFSGDAPIDRMLHVGECIETVQDFHFDPTMPPGVVQHGGRLWWNTYALPSVVSEPGDVTPFVNYLEHLVPDQESREHLVKMLAHQVRNPGDKLTYALLMTSREHGTGKSTLFEIMFELLGSTNCRKATSEEVESQYQAYLQGKLFVLVEEINLGKGLVTYNKLKDYISSKRAPVRVMYKDTFEAPNWANFAFCSNLDRAILLEPEDRRVFVVAATEELRDPEYWAEFRRWWKANLPQIRWYFDQVDLADFNPSARPPLTEAKMRLIHDSRRPVVRELQELLDGGSYPFHSDIVTRAYVQQHLKQSMDVKVTTREVESAMREVGGIELGQHNLRAQAPGRSLKASLRTGVTKPSLWAIRNARYWKLSTPTARVDEYLAETGSLCDAPELPAGFDYLPLSLCPPPAVEPEYCPISEVFGEGLLKALNEDQDRADDSDR